MPHFLVPVIGRPMLDRLLVDLMLRVRNSGFAAMTWADLKQSVSTTRALCSEYPAPYPGEGTALDTFVSRVITKLPDYLHVEHLQLVKDQWHWQWHIALAREFLRQATYREMTPPRVGLALLSSACHLQYGVNLLDGVRFR